MAQGFAVPSQVALVQMDPLEKPRAWSVEPSGVGSNGAPSAGFQHSRNRKSWRNCSTSFCKTPKWPALLQVGNSNYTSSKPTWNLPSTTSTRTHRSVGKESKKGKRRRKRGRRTQKVNRGAIRRRQKKNKEGKGDGNPKDVCLL